MSRDALDAFGKLLMRDTMNTDDALLFLRMHQPMPADEEMSDEEFEQYARGRRYLQDHPTAESIPLLLNSFGEGSGYGQYQLVEDVIRPFPKEVVLPQLLKALGSRHRSVRYWCAQIASEFPDPTLIPPLALLLQDSDSDIRCAAITALVQIEDARIVTLLQSVQDREHGPEVQQILKMAFEDLGHSRR